jgi:hypothetical protein
LQRDNDQRPRVMADSPDALRVATDRISVDKRRLLKAAWLPPAVLAIGLPRSGFAANISSSRPDPKAQGQNGHHFGRDKER